MRIRLTVQPQRAAHLACIIDVIARALAEH
jgi:hypothetical protein